MKKHSHQPTRKFPLMMINSKAKIHVYTDDDSSEDPSQVMGHQEHGRVYRESSFSSSTTTTSASSDSITSSLTRFRDDFEDLKCKMVVFGESLNLCNCIAGDFRNKLKYMERRLEILEKRHKIYRLESNYSAIIQKNRKLSCKTLNDAKKLQTCGTEEEMREVAARICRNYLHGAWKTVQPSELDFRKMSGGLSNFLYYVALPDKITKYEPNVQFDSPDSDKKVLPRVASFTMDEPRKVLLRIYGQVHGERAMDAIVTESVIFTLLSERRLGPKLYGVFSGGRIEEYIPARSLFNRELSEPAISMKIAEKMAAIHSMDVPLSKESSWLWKTTGKWWKTTKEERWPKVSAKNKEEERILKLLKAIDFDKELEWLKKFTASVESPIVFCHNDMQEGNILILEDSLQATEDDEYTSSFSSKSDKENNQSTIFEALAFDDNNTSDDRLSYTSDNGEPRLVLIDFEYCAYNYRGFDIANHFQEWMYEYTNPEYPYYFEHAENLPTLEQKEIFLKQYLKHYHSNLDKDPPTIDDINQLFTEVEAYELASNLLWCLWTTNSSTSAIPFGYWEYALSRYEQYMRLKQEVIKKDKLGLPQKRKICEVDI